MIQPAARGSAEAREFITCGSPHRSRIYLMLVYNKNEASALTPDQKKKLRGTKAALHALDNLTEFPAVLEFWIDEGAHRADFKIDFAGELTAIAMNRHKLADESHTHYGRLFTRVRLALAHAVRCGHLLSWHYLQERFRS